MGDFRWIGSREVLDRLLSTLFPITGMLLGRVRAEEDYWIKNEVVPMDVRVSPARTGAGFVRRCTSHQHWNSRIVAPLGNGD